MTVERAVLLQRSGQLSFPIPDALMAILLAAAAAVEFFPERAPHFLLAARQDLFFALVVEGGFLMMQGTLVDIATRLRKRPPVWAVVLITGGVLLFSGHALEIVRWAWQRGTVAFIPIALSLMQRATILWHMPDRSRNEKIAARALIGNRITTGLGVLGIATALMVTGVIFPERFTFGDWIPLALGSLYFAIAAFDDWRVRRPAFAENPRVLFRFDPIGLKYLEAL
jgi:hypothetical protein